MTWIDDISVHSVFSSYHELSWYFFDFQTFSSVRFAVPNFQPCVCCTSFTILTKLVSSAPKKNTLVTSARLWWLRATAAKSAPTMTSVQSVTKSNKRAPRRSILIPSSGWVPPEASLVSARMVEISRARTGNKIDSRSTSVSVDSRTPSSVEMQIVPKIHAQSKLFLPLDKK